MLTIERDIKNKYDPFAIAIHFNNQMVGYIPREYSKTIATEIDLNSKQYSIKVIDIKENLELNDIAVEMIEIN